MFRLKNKKEKGFTLIELLVSIAIFSIALVMILGATISIVDANKKSRTLMVVMNNLNFAVDSMTRSFSTGVEPTNSLPLVNLSCTKGFKTEEIDYANTSSSLKITPRTVYYCWKKTDINSVGKIYKVVGNNVSELTSPDIDITYANFDLDNGNGEQPKLRINLEGTANVGGKISSTFQIQTTVSQKKLKFD